MLDGEPVQDLAAELSVSDATQCEGRRQALIDAIAATITARPDQLRRSLTWVQGAEMNRQTWRTVIERQPHPAPQFPGLPDAQRI